MLPPSASLLRNSGSSTRAGFCRTIRSSKNTVRAGELPGAEVAVRGRGFLLTSFGVIFFFCRCWGEGYPPGGTGSSSDSAPVWSIFWDRVCLSYSWWGTPAWHSGAWGLCSRPECQQLCHGWNLQSSCEPVFLVWEGFVGESGSHYGSCRERRRQVF